MTWKHYPNSPFGDIDICDHGCTRAHGSTAKECLLCDYPPSYFKQLKMLPCPKCNPKGSTWHYHGKCLCCNRELSEQEVVQFT